MCVSSFDLSVRVRECVCLLLIYLALLWVRWFVYYYYSSNCKPANRFVIVFFFHGVFLVIRFGDSSGMRGHMLSKVLSLVTLLSSYTIVSILTWVSILTPVTLPGKYTLLPTVLGIAEG